MKKFLSSKIMKITIIILIIIGLVVGAYVIYNKVSSSASANQVAAAVPVRVERGDIEVKISGTGTVKPYDRYDITPLVQGNIISSPYEEGMQVKKGDLLYEIDHKSLSFNIEKAQNKIEELKSNHQSTLESINNLQVYAPCDGVITDFNLKTDEQVGNNSRIATVVNNVQLTASLGFTESQVKEIYIGQAAQLIVPQYMTYIDGRVTYINNVFRTASDGAVLYDVEITINNPGAISAGMSVNGLVKASNGDIISPVSGIIKNSEEKPVIVKTSGTVKNIYVKDGQWVKAGQIILELKNDDLLASINNYELQMRELQLSLDEQLEKLGDYNITSPIDGTIIVKNYKAGEAINNAGSNVVLMTIADMSKMKFTLGVDELDIAKIQIGQRVHITADALPGMSFEGEIFNIPAEGESQNGVTTYPVEVVIPNPGELKSGMNVNAEVVVESRKDVLRLPIGAVTKEANKSFVMVKRDGSKNSEPGTASGPNDSAFSQERTRAQNDNQAQRRGQREASGQSNFQDRQNAQAGQRVTPRNTESTPQQNARNFSNETVSINDLQRKEVEIGINNEEYIEIISGLEEGEIVYQSMMRNQSQGGVGTSNMPRGGMPGGGFPAGGVRVRMR